MKYVHDTRKIAHLWMHKEQSHARNVQNNFYFQNSTIYSYGSHFPIASHAQTNAGEQCVIMTTRGHSSTTAKHLHLVRMAIPGNVPVFHAPWPLPVSGTHAENISSLQNDVIRAAQELGACPKRRPSIAKARRALDAAINTAVRYCEAFGTPEQVETIKAYVCIDDEQLAQLRQRVAQEREAERQRRQEAAARAQEANAEYLKNTRAQLQAWKRGEDSLPLRAHYLPPVLRIVGDQVETSLGVTMSLGLVIRGLRLLDRLNTQGQTGERTGEKIGQYDLLEVSAEKVVIGCHHIPISEVNWLRDQLAGWSVGDESQDQPVTPSDPRPIEPQAHTPTRRAGTY